MLFHYFPPGFREAQGHGECESAGDGIGRVLGMCALRVTDHTLRHFFALGFGFRHYNGFLLSRVHSMHKHLSYMRDTLWPTPPASGGTGSSPLRSETNAAYLGGRKKWVFF